MSRPKGIFTAALFLFIVAGSTMGQAPDILYLQFNEGGGATTTDAAVPGVAAAPLLIGSAAWDAAPRLGASALYMPAGAAAGNYCATNVPLGLSGAWSVEFWFRNDDSGTTLRYIFGDNSANSFRCYKSGASPASIYLAGTGMTSLTLPSAAPFGQWVHVAYVHDDVTNEVRGYVDGVLVASQAQTSALSFIGGSGAGLTIGGYGTSSQTVGAIDEFRLYSFARSGSAIAAERSIELQSYVADLAAAAISGPQSSAGCDPLGGAETISFVVRNVGSTALPAGSLLMASYSIDGGPAVSEAFLTTAAISTSAPLALSFASPADLSAIGARTIDVSVTMAGDLNATNDSVQRVVKSGGDLLVSSFPWVENFDGSAALNTTLAPLGWKQDQADATGTDSDWYFRTGTTSSTNTGPSGDNTSGAGYYAYVEDSSGNFAQVNLVSPCLDMSLLAAPMLQFALHSRNGNTSSTTVNENFISVDVISFPGGVVTTDLFGPIGHVGDNWSLQSASLAAFAGQTVQLVFRGRSDGGSFTHDIAIDDVTVFEQQAAMGQAPRPGLAVFDLNGAVNPNQLPVSSAAAGPYSAVATASAPLVMSFEGEPNQPILLLFGPLNVTAASYPNVGQFDIGGPVDATGLPTQLSVVANGFNAVTLMNAFFTTGGAGATVMNFQTPPFPAGPVGGLQAVIGTSQSYLVALSNAVDLSIM